MKGPPPWSGRGLSRYQFLFTKFDHWAYEQEYRISCKLSDADPGGHFYEKFSRLVRLREVIIGARNTTISKRELIGALNGLQGVTYFKVRPAFRTFTMTKQHSPKFGIV